MSPLECTGMFGANLKCNKYVCLINKCMIVLCVSCLLLSVQNVHEMDCLREETVSVSGRSGAQSSVASTRTVQRGSVLDVRGPE